MVVKHGVGDANSTVYKIGMYHIFVMRRAVFEEREAL